MEIKFCFRSHSGQQELKKTTKRDFLLLKIKSLGTKVYGVRKTLEIMSNVNIRKITERKTGDSRETVIVFLGYYNYNYNLKHLIRLKLVISVNNLE